jgi:histone deacetylase complex regulatory component SIN3
VLLLFTGEQGPTVVDLVKKNPAVALGVVLPRLLQKDEEWCAAAALPLFSLSMTRSTKNLPVA